MDSKHLAQAFDRAQYRVAGHGPRDVAVLKEALADVPAGKPSDIYGTGEVIEAFQQKIADFLGHESAVFFPSGTMAQQIALRIWCDEANLKRVAYHPLCHLEIHEEGGLEELHHIEPVLISDPNELITLEDVKAVDQEIACLLLELPQREIGGQLPEFSELEAISAYCRKNGIRLHLDGARLLEILPYYGKTAAEVAALFDSVYISFYKGIGGVAGAILAGPDAFTEKSKVWKRRHGGDLISLYPYIISADHHFEKRKDHMGRYHEYAKELALFFNGVSRTVTRPEKPVSNMFHVLIDLPADTLAPILAQVAEETGVALSSYLREIDNDTVYFEISLGDSYADIPRASLEKAFKLLDEKIEQAD